MEPSSSIKRKKATGESERRMPSISCRAERAESTRASPASAEKLEAASRQKTHGFARQHPVDVNFSEGLVQADDAESELARHGDLQGGRHLVFHIQPVCIVAGGYQENPRHALYLARGDEPCRARPARDGACELSFAARPQHLARE